ncbi:MAG: hypothetical protein JW860_13750 [Sedimentisphaerales bacterium]|nr:hypothetical protein [Sedimentisphaerales bacterium]
MHPRQNWAVIGNLVFITLLQVGASETPVPVSPHHFQLACQTCHEPPADIYPESDPSEWSPQVGPVFINVDQACNISGCHMVDQSLSHIR